MRHFPLADGVEWSLVPGVTGLRDVWASGPGEAWGVSGTTTVAHGVGASATTIVPAPPAGPLFLLSVFASSASDVWVGTNVLHRFDGTSWTSTNVNIGLIHDIWGRDADDVWLAGDAILHWDGSSFSRFELPLGTDSAQAIAGTATGDVFVATFLGDLLASTAPALSPSRSD